MSAALLVLLVWRLWLTALVLVGLVVREVARTPLLDFAGASLGQLLGGAIGSAVGGVVGGVSW